MFVAILLFVFVLFVLYYVLAHAFVFVPLLPVLVAVFLILIMAGLLIARRVRNIL